MGFTPLQEVVFIKHRDFSRDIMGICPLFMTNDSKIRSTHIYQCNKHTEINSILKKTVFWDAAPCSLTEGLLP